MLIQIPSIFFREICNLSENIIYYCIFKRLHIDYYKLRINLTCILENSNLRLRNELF